MTQATLRERVGRHAASRVCVLATVALLLLPAGAAATSPPVKTLEDIRIDGEIRLPRVLFITSRDADRPLDFLEHYAVHADVPPTGEPLPVVGPVPSLPTTPPESAGATEIPSPVPTAANDAPEEVSR